MEKIKQNFEKHLWHLFENGTQSFYILEDDKIVYANHSFAKTVGYSQEEMIGRNILDFIHPEDKVKFDQCITICFAKKLEKFSSHVRIITKKGDILQIIMSARQVNENEAYLIGTTENITEKQVLKNDLEKVTQNFSSLLQNSPHAIFSLDLNGLITYWNPACEHLFGWKKYEVIGTPLPIVPTDKQDEFKKFFNGAIHGEVFTDIEVVRQRKDGSSIELSFSTAPIYNANYHVEGYMAITFDISEKKRIEKEIHTRKQELILSKERLNRLIQNSYDIIGITDQNGKIIYQSPTFEKVTNYQTGKFIGRNSFELIHPDDHQTVSQVFQDLTLEPTKPVTFQFRLQNADGTWMYCEAIGTNLLHDPSINGILFNYWDITETKLNEQNLHSATYHDFLTSIGNQRLIEETLTSEVKKAKENSTILTYMLLDLDGFKFINDSLGHDYGDLLLKEIATKIKGTFQDKGVVARIGGDEFSILIPDVQSLDDITKEAEKVMALFQNPFFVGNHEFYITSSLGVSIFPYSGETANDLLKSVDLAMYHAKELGKNQYALYTPTLDIGTYKAFTLQNDLRKALSNNELTLYYQPKVESSTNKMIGAEALIRWKHPKWGMVSPKEFISIAEKSGIIIPIGQWILEHVCQQIVQWQKRGLPALKVSINFSPLQFVQADLVEMIQSTLEHYQVDPKLLEIEITESAVLDNEQDTLRKINDLKEFGIHIAIDDFGTGYSSLLYLKKMKVDTIKIDQSFVKDLDQDNIESANIVAAIIQLAKNLKINIVAEGVETTGQALILKQLKCDELQGYLFSKPVPANEFEKLLQMGVFILDKKEEIPLVNKRKFFRVNLPFPLEAEMTLEKIGGKKVTLGTTRVLIDNIGPGGQSFYSNIHLPIKPDITLLFTTTIFEQTIDLHGKVVWMKELEDGIFHYGLQFEVDEDFQSNLIIILNKLQVKLNHKSSSAYGRFMQTEVRTYFK